MKHRCIIYVHGGSWTHGEPTEIDRYRAALGCDVIAVPYTLIPHTTMGGQISQVAEAIRDAKRDYVKVYVMGYSAGGQLAVMAARREKVDGVIALCAPLDFSKVAAMRLIRFLLLSFDPIRAADSDCTDTLVIHGDTDETVFVDAAKNYVRKAKNSSLTIVPKKGHTLTVLDDPEARRRIKTFLER